MADIDQTYAPKDKTPATPITLGADLLSKREPIPQSLASSVLGSTLSIAPPSKYDSCLGLVPGAYAKCVVDRDKAQLEAFVGGSHFSLLAGVGNETGAGAVGGLGGTLGLKGYELGRAHLPLFGKPYQDAKTSYTSGHQQYVERIKDIDVSLKKLEAELEAKKRANAVATPRVAPLTEAEQRAELEKQRTEEHALVRNAGFGNDLVPPLQPLPPTDTRGPFERTIALGEERNQFFLDLNPARLSLNQYTQRPEDQIDGMKRLAAEYGQRIDSNRVQPPELFTRRDLAVAEAHIDAFAALHALDKFDLQNPPQTQAYTDAKAYYDLAHEEFVALTDSIDSGLKELTGAQAVKAQADKRVPPPATPPTPAEQHAQLLKDYASARATKLGYLVPSDPPAPSSTAPDTRSPVVQANGAGKERINKLRQFDPGNPDNLDPNSKQLPDQTKAMDQLITDTHAKINAGEIQPPGLLTHDDLDLAKTVLDDHAKVIEIEGQARATRVGPPTSWFDTFGLWGTKDRPFPGTHPTRATAQGFGAAWVATEIDESIGLTPNGAEGLAIGVVAGTSARAPIFGTTGNWLKNTAPAAWLANRFPAQAVSLAEKVPLPLVGKAAVLGAAWVGGQTVENVWELVTSNTGYTKELAAAKKTLEVDKAQQTPMSMGQAIDSWKQFGKISVGLEGAIAFSNQLEAKDPIDVDAADIRRAAIRKAAIGELLFEHGTPVKSPVGDGGHFVLPQFGLGKTPVSYLASAAQDMERLGLTVESKDPVAKRLHDLSLKILGPHNLQPVALQLQNEIAQQYKEYRTQHSGATLKDVGDLQEGLQERVIRMGLEYMKSDAMQATDDFLKKSNVAWRTHHITAGTLRDLILVDLAFAQVATRLNQDKTAYLRDADQALRVAAALQAKLKINDYNASDLATLQAMRARM